MSHDDDLSRVIHNAQTRNRSSGGITGNAVALLGLDDREFHPLLFGPCLGGLFRFIAGKQHQFHIVRLPDLPVGPHHMRHLPAAGAASACRIKKKIIPGLRIRPVLGQIIGFFQCFSHRRRGGVLRLGGRLIGTHGKVPAAPQPARTRASEHILIDFFIILFIINYPLKRQQGIQEHAPLEKPAYCVDRHMRPPSLPQANHSVLHFSEPFNRTSNTAAPTAECQKPFTAAVYFKTLRPFLQRLKETSGKHHGRGSY